MTSEQYDKLTDEEKRIKVAELCGWSTLKITLERGRKMMHETTGQVGYAKDVLPDYINDLNAMREAELVMLAQRRVFKQGWLNSEVYTNNLGRILDCSDKEDWILCVTATAAQRAKAFVLTMGGSQ